MQLGIALGSGGARGLAHVGVLAVLEEAGLRPDVIAGTSMGSIVGALFAETPDPEIVAEKLWAYAADPEFKGSWEPFIEDDLNLENRGFLGSIWRSVQRRYLTYKTFSAPSQQSAERLMEPLQRLFSATSIEELKLPFAAMAVDLRGGEARVFDSGPLVDAIYASSAIPGVFPPLDLDGQLLIDGGGPFRVPVGLCRRLGADFVLAVDIPSFAPEEKDYKTGLEVLMRSDAVARNRLNKIVLEQADFVVKPQVSEFHWANFGAANPIREAGEQAMRDALPELRRRLKEREGLLHRFGSSIRRLFDRSA
jgi:NTE family protein